MAAIGPDHSNLPREWDTVWVVCFAFEQSPEEDNERELKQQNSIHCRQQKLIGFIVSP